MPNRGQNAGDLPFGLCAKDSLRQQEVHANMLTAPVATTRVIFCIKKLDKLPWSHVIHLSTMISQPYAVEQK